MAMMNASSLLPFLPPRDALSWADRLAVLPTPTLARYSKSAPSRSAYPLRGFDIYNNLILTMNHVFPFLFYHLR